MSNNNYYCFIFVSATDSLLFSFLFPCLRILSQVTLPIHSIIYPVTLLCDFIPEKARDFIPERKKKYNLFIFQAKIL